MQAIVQAVFKYHGLPVSMRVEDLAYNPLIIGGSDNRSRQPNTSTALPWP
jgi:hypothetical protein